MAIDNREDWVEPRKTLFERMSEAQKLPDYDDLHPLQRQAIGDQPMTVTDEDRDAAKWYHGPTCQSHSFMDSPCTCGVVQAFAAHRIAAENARIAKLEAALKTLADKVSRFNGIHSCQCRVAGRAQGEMWLAMKDALSALEASEPAMIRPPLIGEVW